MDTAHAYEEAGEMEVRESGVQESTELLTRRVEGAMKVASVLKDRLGPLRVNTPRPVLGDDEMTKKDPHPPARSEHAALLRNIAGEVADLTATLDDVLQTLDI